MTIIRLIKPYFVASRVFGCAPYSFDSSGISALRFGTLYAVISVLVHSCAFYVNVNTGLKWMRQYGELSASYLVKIVALQLCLLIDVVISVFTQKRFVSAIDKLRRFDDRMSGYGRRHVVAMLKYYVTFAACWGFFSVTWYITYATDLNDGLMSIIGIHFVYIAFPIGVSRYVMIMHLLFQRYRLLNRSILQESPPVLYVTGQRSYLHLNVVSVWHLHQRLTHVAEEMNSIFSIQLLLWMGIIFLFITLRLYDLFVSRNDIYLYSAVFIAKDFLELFALTGSCHMVTKEANALGSHLQSPKAQFLRKFSRPEEVIEILVSLLQKPLQISAADFMELNLPLVLKMMAAITTYLVMVIQVAPQLEEKQSVITNITNSPTTCD